MSFQSRMRVYISMSRQNMTLLDSRHSMMMSLHDDFQFGRKHIIRIYSYTQQSNRDNNTTIITLPTSDLATWHTELRLFVHNTCILGLTYVPHTILEVLI